MRSALLIFLLLTFAACSRSKSFDADAARNWNQSADAQNRKKASSYSFQRSDSSWVCISTAVLTESSTGFIYDSGPILKTGYLVYPGGHEAQELAEAIRIASTIPGRRLQQER